MQKANKIEIILETLVPEPLLLGMDPVQESGIFKKMIGAGKTVVNYGNQVGNRIIGRNPNLYPMLYF